GATGGSTAGQTSATLIGASAGATVATPAPKAGTSPTPGTFPPPVSTSTPTGTAGSPNVPSSPQASPLITQPVTTGTLGAQASSGGQLPFTGLSLALVLALGLGLLTAGALTLRLTQ